MPPKKRLKVAIKPKGKAAGPASKTKAKPKPKTKTNLPVKSPRRTRSKDRNTSKTIEAAKGAGIRSTEELQDYMQNVRENQDDLHLNMTAQENLEFPDVNEEFPQTSNNATPDDEDDITSSSESSDPSDDSDSPTDERPSDASSGHPSPPVKRKLPFNRKTKEFQRVDISPGSLQDGKDTRDLGKLQEILLANPDAVSALDSMIQVLRANKPTSTTVPQPPQPQQSTDDPPRRGPMQGTSETTIYTRAVPSASPSQEQQVNQTVAMDRLAMSLNAVDAASNLINQPAQVVHQQVLSLNNAITGEPITEPANLLSELLAGQVAREPSCSTDAANKTDVHQERVAAKT